jgi:AAA domain
MAGGPDRQIFAGQSEHSPSITDTTAAWCKHRVVVFFGSFDTHINDGDDYDTLTLGEVFDAAPARQDKANAPAMIPSSYCKFNARKHEAQRQHGSYSALAGDIDTGNVPMEQVQAVVAEFVGDHVATLIYSSSGATEQTRKWRVIVPLEQPVTFDRWRDFQEAFFGFMEACGIVMDWALARAGQPVYLPNVPVDKRDFKGEPLFHQRHFIPGRGLTARDGMAERALSDVRVARERDEAERQRAQQAAKQAMQVLGTGGKGAVIDAFNKTYSVEMMLEATGYRRGPGDSWRSPYQSGKTFATKNFGEYWVSMSASDAGAGVGAGCASGRFGDAFDLYCHFDHKGEIKKAVREAAKVLGLNKHPATGTPVDDSGIMAQAARAAQAPKAKPYTDYGADSGIMASFAAGSPSPAPEGESEKVDWLARLRQATPPRPTFEFVPAGDLVREPQPVEYLVDELIEHPSLLMLFGAPSAGKSFVAISMAACVATGHPWLGRDVRKGPVFYLAGEGHAGVSRRLRAWEIETGVSLEVAPLFVSKLPAQLMNAENAKMVEQAINELCAKHETPALIVIDTLARNMGSGDESSNADIGQFVAAIDGMRHRLGCTVELVHHSGHLETERARGASALPAAMDASFQMEDKGGTRSLTQKKSKESELAAPIPLTLKEVPIGWKDAKGREISSAVIALADAHEAATPKSKTLTARQQEGLQSLCKAVVDQDALAAQDGDWLGAHVESWRVEFYRTCTADDKKKAFQRVRDDLKTRSLVRIEYDICYVRQSEPGLIAQNLTAKMKAAGHGT